MTSSTHTVTVSYRHIPLAAGAKFHDGTADGPAFVELDAPMPVGTQLQISGKDGWEQGAVVATRETEDGNLARGCWLRRLSDPVSVGTVGSESLHDGAAGAVQLQHKQDSREPSAEMPSETPDLPIPAPVMEPEPSEPIDINEYMATIGLQGHPSESAEGVSSESDPTGHSEQDPP